LIYHSTKLPGQQEMMQKEANHALAKNRIAPLYQQSKPATKE